MSVDDENVKMSDILQSHIDKMRKLVEGDDSLTKIFDDCLSEMSHVNASMKDASVEQLPDNDTAQNIIEENVPDYSSEIHDLEARLSEMKPSFSLTEYNPKINYWEELDGLVGLESFKQQLRQFIVTYKQQLVRQSLHPGLKVNLSFNCVFKGKPGTGKTTVARLVAGILKQEGLLRKGCYVESDATDLTSGYVGFSADFAKLAALKAMDGVLFIDEAYALLNTFQTSRGAGPGKDVIDALTPIMENNRSRLVVIIAGYDREMEEFLSSANSGFPSRFKNVVEFPDYTADEMLQIFCNMASEEYYVLPDEVKRRAYVIFKSIYEHRDKVKSFANARTVRSIFEKTKERQSIRIQGESNADMDIITLDDMSLTSVELKSTLGIF